MWSLTSSIFAGVVTVYSWRASLFLCFFASFLLGGGEFCKKRNCCWVVIVLG